MPDGTRSSGPNVPIGFMVVGSEMVSFTVLGLILDYALGTLPWITVILTPLGVAIAFIHLVKMSKSLTRKTLPPSSHAQGADEKGPM